MNVRLFKIFKAYHHGTLVSKSKIEESTSSQTDYSFLEIDEKFKGHNLNNVVFQFIDDRSKEGFQLFFQIKLSRFIRNGRQKSMLQFIDISKAILYDMEKSHNVVLSMINACVSHEMRNPLNSIIAQNIEKKEVYQELT